MKHPAPLTTLSLLALALSTAQSAQAEEVLNFAPPSAEKTVAIAPVPVASPAPNSGILSFNPPTQEIGDRTQESGADSTGEAGIRSVERGQESGAKIVRLSAHDEVQNPKSKIQNPKSPIQNPTDPFSGGAHSLVAHAVGAAEGTRTPTGDKTPAYYGHKDPGNGVWNQGSFSYQHGAKTPEEADQKQLRRLAKQDAVLQQRAAVLGLAYLDDLEVRLNGIDLANQAPLAAIAEDGGGYLDRLKQAQEMGLAGTDAVLWARVRSYLDPDTGRWNAPGLGNTVDRIAHDQERRMSRIAETLAVYQPSVAMAEPIVPTVQAKPKPATQPDIPAAPIEMAAAPDTTATIGSDSVPSNPSASATPTLSHKEAIADQIIFQAPDPAEPRSGDPLSFMPR
jgi:hypothetical protein